MVMDTKGKKIEDLDLKNTEKLILRKDEIFSTTYLSKRESEIYVLYTDEENQFKNMKDVAEALGIDQGTVYKHKRNIKDKISKSKATVELGKKLG